MTEFSKNVHLPTRSPKGELPESSLSSCCLYEHLARWVVVSSRLMLVIRARSWEDDLRGERDSEPPHTLREVLYLFTSGG